MKYLAFISAIFTLMACQSMAVQPNTKILWVDGQTKICAAGAGKMPCLQVTQGENLGDNPQWQNFSAPIEGFTVQNGLRQKILVEETQKDPQQVPTDASNLQYTLLEVMETMPMEKAEPHNINRLHDIWAVTHLLGHEIAQRDTHQPLPTIEFHSQEKKAMGTDGCNHFMGELVALDNHTLQFGTLASTMKMCLDMNVPTQFNQAIEATARYHINGLTLTLEDNAGRELMRLKKVD